MAHKLKNKLFFFLNLVKKKIVFTIYSYLFLEAKIENLHLSHEY